MKLINYKELKDANKEGALNCILKHLRTIHGGSSMCNHEFTIASILTVIIELEESITKLKKEFYWIGFLKKAAILTLLGVVMLLIIPPMYAGFFACGYLICWMLPNRGKF